MRAGLTRRTLLASAILALIVGGAFAVMRAAVEDGRRTTRLARHSRAELETVDRLAQMIVDAETGARGFVITRQDRFLQPWQAARANFPAVAASLGAFADDPVQIPRAHAIARAGTSYIEDYSVPLIAAARRGARSTRSVATTEDGKRRVDALRAEFLAYRRREDATVDARERASDTDNRRAILGASVGVVASAGLILLFGGYLARTIVLPIRRASSMAGRVASGDLSARVPEGGAAEIGALERALNTMGQSLEKSRDELRLLADEQGALRRVATLVARDVPPEQVWDAAAAEVGWLLGADATTLLRAGDGGTVTAVAVWGDTPMDAGASAVLPDDTAPAAVIATGRPAKTQRGDEFAVAAPIIVEGRPWGVLAAMWGPPSPPSADAEQRLTQFSELVATAIANASGRADLIASRARVVATADETRRRIQRDLHDGAQQRLVHAVITLKLAKQELAGSPGPLADLVDEALAHGQRATTALRDLVHGILPGALTRGGLKRAIEALAAEAPLPVSMDVTAQRLPPALEATAYFIVAEGLTNIAKHANATHAEVTVRVKGELLEVEVRDDGVGGARLDGSYGLMGLKDRAAAMNGELRVESPPGRGTSITATLPIPIGDRAGTNGPPRA